VAVFDLSEGLFETVKAGIRLRYPEADEREAFLRAVASRVPRELMIRAYGWDPAMHVACARPRSRSSKHWTGSALFNAVGGSLASSLHGIARATRLPPSFI
jgi:hypothetical protein